jgi:hypothetical protein
MAPTIVEVEPPMTPPALDPRSASTLLAILADVRDRRAAQGEPAKAA